MGILFAVPHLSEGEQIEGSFAVNVGFSKGLVRKY